MKWEETSKKVVKANLILGSLGLVLILAVIGLDLRAPSRGFQIFAGLGLFLVCLAALVWIGLFIGDSLMSFRRGWKYGLIHALLNGLGLALFYYIFYY